MASHDTLVLIAELGVAIAGFSGVVVALGGRGVRPSSRLERHNLRILLEVSALVIFFSLFPLIIERVVEAPELWRWSLLLYGVAHLADVLSFVIGPPAGVTRVHRISAYTGIVIALAQLVVAAWGSILAAEMAYLSTLVWHLGIAGMGFSFLVFGRQSSAQAEVSGSS